SRQYLMKVGEQVSGKTIERGGPIILVQVENEYGSFGSDHEYMSAIRDQLVGAGFDGELFTSDGPTPAMLEGGTLPGVTSVINFGSRPEERFAEFAKFRTNVPRMCGELWFGWFDHWGCEHHSTPTETQVEDLDWFMREGVSFNLYMFHGGTNWGFMNGANWTADGYRPDVSSYDYDAALAEDGRLTAKWHAFRAVIEKHLTEPLPEVPAEALPGRLREVPMTSSCPMMSLKGKGVDGWKSFEELGHGYGYVLYQVKLAGPGSGVLTLDGLQDYAVIMSDGRIMGTVDRRLGECALRVTHGGKIEILVENTGRINYARQMLAERKGIVTANLDGVPLFDVIAFPIDFSLAEFTEGIELAEPALYRGEFHVEEPHDTHLDSRGWGKGNVWVNGFNLGRHWDIGPQQTTYCPATVLKPGLNEIIVSDLMIGRKRSIVGLPDPILSKG
ncbi:MAG: beta-galactosidase, partial [Fimbriimonadaceae bacterium]|nr:beta-galactosidase [Fimbriimonadaceae bacterium]